MKEAKPDWEAIKTEYIQTRITAKNLAMKYGVKATTLVGRCTREGWVALRQEYRGIIKQEPIKTVVRGCMMKYCAEYSSTQDCQKCGFYADEAERRKRIPLTVGKNGLRRKRISKEEVHD